MKQDTYQTSLIAFAERYPVLKRAFIERAFYGEQHPFTLLDSSDGYRGIHLSDDELNVLGDLVQVFINTFEDAKEQLQNIEDCINAYEIVCGFGINTSAYEKPFGGLRDELRHVVTDMSAMIFRLVSLLADNGADVSAFGNFKCPRCSKVDVEIAKAEQRAQKTKEIESKHPRNQP